MRIRFSSLKISRNKNINATISVMDMIALKCIEKMLYVVELPVKFTSFHLSGIT